MAEDRLTLCLSLPRVALSQYDNYNFNSMCNFDGMLLGSNEDGLFVLDSGESDDGSLIDAHFKFGSSDLGLDEHKSIRYINIAGRLGGMLQVSVNADGAGDIKRQLSPERTDLRQMRNRVYMGKDCKGKYLELKVENVQGADFTVNRIDALVVKKVSK